MHMHHLPTNLGYCCECKPNPLIFMDLDEFIHFNDECTLFCDKTFQEQPICQCLNYPSFNQNHFNHANRSTENLPC